MELENIKTSPNFVSKDYEQLKLNCKQLIEINKKQEEEINKLNNKSIEIELKHKKEKEKVDALEQYYRRQNLEIMGIPFKGENKNI